MNKFIITFVLAYSSILSAGAQDVLTIEQGITDISAEKGKNFYCIQMKRNIPEGVYSAFAVPATVDGYYFGVDAPRFEVKNMSEAGNGEYNLDMTPMAGTDDFEPGKLYMVKPENGWGVTTDSPIVCLTAGIKTTVTISSQPLTCTNDIKACGAVSSIVKIVAKMNGKDGTTPTATDIANGKRDIEEILKMMKIKK